MWAVESLVICTFMGSFFGKHIKFQMKKYRRVISHDTDEWYKVWRKTGSWFQKDMENLVTFNMNRGKSENLHIKVLLLIIAYKVSTKEWPKLWRKTHFLFEKWHEKFGES